MKGKQTILVMMLARNIYLFMAGIADYALDNF